MKLTTKQYNTISNAAYDIEKEAEELVSLMNGQMFNAKDLFALLRKLKGAPKSKVNELTKLINHAENALTAAQDIAKDLSMWAEDKEFS